MPRRKPRPRPVADEIRVSVGMAVVGGLEVRGIGVHHIGEQAMWFLPVEHDLASSGRASTWVQINESDYDIIGGPLDESLIDGPGLSGHRYLIETPAPLH